jgi:hypothetical protein
MTAVGLLSLTSIARAFQDPIANIVDCRLTANFRRNALLPTPPIRCRSQSIRHVCHACLACWRWILPLSAASETLRLQMTCAILGALPSVTYRQYYRADENKGCFRGKLHLQARRSFGSMQPQPVSCLLRPGCIKGPVFFFLILILTAVIATVVMRSVVVQTAACLVMTARV